MLKIKDSVDLKELEKFGFEYVEIQYGKEYHLLVDGEILSIMEDNRGVYIQTENIFDIAEDSLGVLFDLIKADLVEKLENDC
jgi:hypothetical protein